MGSYHPHRHTRRRPARVCENAPQSLPAPRGEDTAERREQITRERESLRQFDANRQARADARREQRASDALRASVRRDLEVRARLLFPWELMAIDRELAAILSGQPRGALFPVFDLAQFFAGVNLGVSPREFCVSETVAIFMVLSAPRTRLWPELTRAADFFIAAHALEGRAFDRAELLDQARCALAKLESRLSALPDWLTVHELRGSWFIIRPTRETAKAMWKEVVRANEGPIASAPDDAP